MHAATLPTSRHPWPERLDLHAGRPATIGRGTIPDRTPTATVVALLPRKWSRRCSLVAEKVRPEVATKDDDTSKSPDERLKQQASRARIEVRQQRIHFVFLRFQGCGSAFGRPPASLNRSSCLTRFRDVPKGLNNPLRRMFRENRPESSVPGNLLQKIQERLRLRGAIVPRRSGP